MYSHGGGVAAKKDLALAAEVCSALLCSGFVSMSLCASGNDTALLGFWCKDLCLINFTPWHALSDKTHSSVATCPGVSTLPRGTHTGLWTTALPGEGVQEHTFSA